MPPRKAQPTKRSVDQLIADVERRMVNERLRKESTEMTEEEKQNAEYEFDSSDEVNDEISDSSSDEDYECESDGAEDESDEYEEDDEGRRKTKRRRARGVAKKKKVVVSWKKVSHKKRRPTGTEDVKGFVCDIVDSIRRSTVLDSDTEEEEEESSGEEEQEISLGSRDSDEEDDSDEEEDEEADDDHNPSINLMKSKAKNVKTVSDDLIEAVLAHDRGAFRRLQDQYITEINRITIGRNIIAWNTFALRMHSELLDEKVSMVLACDVPAHPGVCYFCKGRAGGEAVCIVLNGVFEYLPVCSGACGIRSSSAVGLLRMYQKLKDMFEQKDVIFDQETVRSTADAYQRALDTIRSGAAGIGARRPK